MYTKLLPGHFGTEVDALTRVGSDRLATLEQKSFSLSTLRDASVVDERYLSALSLDLQTYFLSDNEPLSSHKVAVANSQDIHRIKGTVASIERAFESFDMAAQIVEWWQSGKQPYYFDVEIGLRDREITIELLTQIREMVMEFKNVRSYLDEVKLSYLVDSNIYINTGGVGEVSINTKMLEGYTETIKTIQNIRAGAVAEATAYANMEVTQWQ